MSDHTPIEKSCSASPLAIVMAAGQGKRMKNPRPKVAHTILGKPMLYWVFDELEKAGVKDFVLVISPHQKEVENLAKVWSEKKKTPVHLAIQDEPKGTGHAALCGMKSAEKHLNVGPERTVIVACGDTPAVGHTTYQALLNHHVSRKFQCTVMGFYAKDPTGYGRVLTDSAGHFLAIREHKDCTNEEKTITLSNSGFLVAQAQVMQEYLPRLSSANASNEYYLTDVPSLAAQDRLKIGVFSEVSEEECKGVNSLDALAAVAEWRQQKIVEAHMQAGVQFDNPKQVYVEESVRLEPGVVVEPFVWLGGDTHIEKGSVHAFQKILNGVKV